MNNNRLNYTFLIKLFYCIYNLLKYLFNRQKKSYLYFNFYLKVKIIKMAKILINRLSLFIQLFYS